EFQKYLKQVKAELVEYIEKNNLNLENSLIDLNTIHETVSSKLSEVKHHNDINKFAIELNPKNELAYINIADDYIEYNNYDTALQFYNDEYKLAFELDSKNSIVDLCWFIGDKHRCYNDIFNAVKRQQDAVNLELGE
ncbi:hypothetical protein IKQ21_06690, partial [bacterium]|nr:hypothetical protein [bacterium]